MKNGQIVSTLRAELLKDDDAKRDKARGGDDSGRFAGFPAPLPEKAEELPAWLKAFEKAAKANPTGRKVLEEEKITVDEAFMLECLNRGVALRFQGPMYRMLAEKFAKPKAGKTKAGKSGKDLSAAEAL